MDTLPLHSGEVNTGRDGDAPPAAPARKVPIYKLERWRDRALAGIDAGLKERETDPVERQLDEANRHIGELVMEVEILRKERQAKHPLVGRRSSR